MRLSFREEKIAVEKGKTFSGPKPIKLRFCRYLGSTRWVSGTQGGPIFGVGCGASLSRALAVSGRDDIIP